MADPQPGVANAAEGTAPESPRLSRLTVIGICVAMLGLAWLVVAFAALPDAPAWGYDVDAYRNAAVR